jgi:hypothetical protein
VISLAVIFAAGGVGNAISQMNKADPGRREPGLSVAQAVSMRKEPAWFTTLMPCAGAALVVAVGLRFAQAAPRPAPATRGARTFADKPAVR